MKKRVSKAKTAVKIKEPKRDRDLPVTKRLLDLTKQELKGDITSLRLEMKAGFAKIDARFKSTNAHCKSIDARFTDMDARFANIDARFTDMDARFTSIDARFTDMDARFTSIDARFHEQNAKLEVLDTKITRMLILMEDQNDRNKATMDHNALIYEKIIANDARIEKLEERVFGIKQS